MRASLDDDDKAPTERSYFRKYQASPSRLHRAILDYLPVGKAGLSPHNAGTLEFNMNRIAVYIGPVDVGEITDDDCLKYVRTRLREAAAETVIRELSQLTRFLDWCIRKKYIVTNPVRGIPKREFGIPPVLWRVKWLEPDQYAALVAAAASYPLMQDAIIFAANTGIRQSNQLKLKREQVNLERREVFLPAPSYKTHRNVVIPLNDLALDAVRRRLAYLEGATHAHKGWLVFGHIDRTTKGVQFFTRHSYHWNKARAAAGLVDFRWHDLRHHRGCSLVQNGVDLLPTSKLLGHATIQATMRYVFLQNSDLHEIVKKHSDRVNSKTPGEPTNGKLT